jgi:hypothetical protein
MNPAFLILAGFRDYREMPHKRKVDLFQNASIPNFTGYVKQAIDFFPKIHTPGLLFLKRDFRQEMPEMFFYGKQ